MVGRRKLGPVPGGWIKVLVQCPVSSVRSVMVNFQFCRMVVSYLCLGFSLVSLAPCAFLLRGCYGKDKVDLPYGMLLVASYPLAVLIMSMLG